VLLFTERLVLDFLLEWDCPWGPSHREIGAATNLSPHGALTYVLAKLERRGMDHPRPPHTNRCVRVKSERFAWEAKSGRWLSLVPLR